VATQPPPELAPGPLVDRELGAIVNDNQFAIRVGLFGVRPERDREKARAITRGQDD
jgi:hypothetical protein